jgi:MFS family permease
MNPYQSNIPKINMHAFFMCFFVIIPILTPLFLSKGISMQEFFELQAYFALVVAIMEIPSGYFSDLFGRKNTLIISGIFVGIGYSTLHLATDYYGLVLFETFVAMGTSFYSGTNVSLMYDSMGSQSREENTKAMGNLHFHLVFSEALAAILASLLVVYGFDIIITFQSIISWIPLMIAFTLKEVPIQKMDKKKHKENFKRILRFLFIEDKLVLLIFVNMFTWGLATFIAVWCYQKLWADLGLPIHYFGYIWACYSFLVAFTSKFSFYFERLLSPKGVILLIPILSIIGYFGMSYSKGLTVIAYGLLFQISRGLNQVIIRDALNWRIPSEFRATANSLQSLCFRGIFFVFAPIIGWSIDTYGMNPTLRSVGIVYSILFFLLIIPFLKEVKKIRE